jgi:CHAT domain-containing protein
MAADKTRRFPTLLWWLLPTLLLVAAALGWQFRDMTVAPGVFADDEPFDAFVASVAATRTRLVDGRLSGFAHAPAPPRVRGPALLDIAPDVRIAAGRLEQLWRENPTPRNTAALGVAFLALRDWDRAIELIEEATQDQPDNASFQSDLSAAYLARAAAADDAEDWAKALAASARAIALDPANPAARFNRALALGGLPLPLAAAAAWDEYATLDRQGPWATEAATRVGSIRRTTTPSQHIRHETEVNTQPLREEIEDRLLAGWGHALLNEQAAAAAKILGDAERKAGELAEYQGDTMARDDIALIRRLERDGPVSRLRMLARGHVLYGQAREEFLRSNFERSADLMAAAASPFTTAGSAYALWAPIYRAIHLRYRRQPALARSYLRTVPLETVPVTYHNLRGRLAWTEGVMWGASGRPDLEREPISRAVEAFRTARERDHQIMTTTLLAETHWYLGDHTHAWSDLRDALTLVADRDWTNRNYHFFLGSLIASGVGLPEVALEFLTARLRLRETAQSRVEVLLQRARLRASLGDSTAALADLDLADEAFALLADETLRESMSRDIEIARTELYSGSDCARAIEHANRAYPALLASPSSSRIVALLAVRARCRQSLGDLAGAKRDLAEAARAFECRRSELGSELDRIRAFEQERAAFKPLVMLEIVSNKDEAAAMRTAERARAGVLTETWRSRERRRAGCQSPDAEIDQGAPALSDSEKLGPDVAVVYYESMDDRVLTWVVTAHTRHMLSAAITPAALRQMVGRIQRAIRRGADLAALKPHSDKLFQSLVAPALKVADDAAAANRQPAPKTIFFVPDGPLFELPFGALPTEDGQPLIRRRAVGVSPSFATFLAASARLSTFVPRDVLAIGDGHDPKASGLPRLPGADDEAVAVGGLYPRGVVLTGGSATKSRVMRERPTVIHFAGHTVVNQHNSRYSQMLLAPDPATGDPGRLLGAEITRSQFGTTAVVVLATCDGAAGPVVEGEGAISVARTFFGAGVPAVVASLWPVADDIPEFAHTFHGQLRAGRDVTHALRDAQLAVLDARGPHSPVAVWGGFIMFGGHGPVH